MRISLPALEKKVLSELKEKQKEQRARAGMDNRLHVKFHLTSLTQWTMKGTLKRLQKRMKVTGPTEALLCEHKASKQNKTFIRSK